MASATSIFTLLLILLIASIALVQADYKRKAREDPCPAGYYLCRAQYKCLTVGTECTRKPAPPVDEKACSRWGFPQCKEICQGPLEWCGPICHGQCWAGKSETAKVEADKKKTLADSDTATAASAIFDKIACSNYGPACQETCFGSYYSCKKHCALLCNWK